MIPEAPPWELEVDDAEEGTCVRFRGMRVQLDLPNSQTLGEQLTRVIEDLGRCRLYLDLSNVVYLNGSALARLILVHQRLQALGGWLCLTNVPPFIYEVFAVTRLNRYLDIRAAADAPADRDQPLPEPAII